MKQGLFSSLLCGLLLMTCSFPQNMNPTQNEIKTLEVKGADVSFLPDIRQSGVKLFNRYNQEEDALRTLKKAGVNLIRLRLWHTPTEASSDFQNVKKLLAEAKQNGFKTMLSIHYSDSWADPAMQTKPVLWQQLTFAQLNDSVEIYTKRIILEMNPDYVQIGNEINYGLLWSEGSSANSFQMKTLLQTGIKAVRETSSATKIILHVALLAGVEASLATLSDLDYDVIGLSYYPIWHGKDLVKLEQRLTAIASDFKKSIFVCETAYPFTLEWNDWTNNIVGQSSQLVDAYPATPEGQKGFLQKMIQIIKNVPKGIGFCYWGGEWISYKGKQATNGSTWENQTFWDFGNKQLPVLDVYAD